MQVRYYDECKWCDTGDGLAYQFVHADGEVLAEIALRNGDSLLWSFEVRLPDRYRIDGSNPAGIVYSQAGARKVAETILLNTIVTR